MFPASFVSSRRGVRPGWKTGAFLWLVLITLNVGFASCGQQRLPTAVLYIEKAGGGTVSLVAELAITDQERATGLMHRTGLPDGEGMLFVFGRYQRLSFWMKNTVIPLSIAFITSDGSITEIRDMRPLDLTPVVSTRYVRYALEVPQGWFGRVGIRPGDVVKLPDIANRWAIN
ncbi:MAG: DUF192 domain-containing protein [Treponema sp.]|nr:DUF192 domain-containing protein [Treponema sp.]